MNTNKLAPTIATLRVLLRRRFYQATPPRAPFNYPSFCPPLPADLGSVVQRKKKKYTFITKYYQQLLKDGFITHIAKCIKLLYYRRINKRLIDILYV